MTVTALVLSSWSLTEPTLNAWEGWEKEWWKNGRVSFFLAQSCVVCHEQSLSGLFINKLHSPLLLYQLARTLGNTWQWAQNSVIHAALFFCSDTRQPLSTTEKEQLFWGQQKSVIKDLGRPLAVMRCATFLINSTLQLNATFQRTYCGYAHAALAIIREANLPQPCATFNYLTLLTN